MKGPQSPLISEIATFRPLDARAARAARLTQDLLHTEGLRVFDRDPRCDHITGSGFVLSKDRTRVLLLHHRKLDLWLQPGGHCDGEADVRAVAAREVAEEIGSPLARLATPEIFDIDVHEIPARGSEPRHFHHDIRYLFEIEPVLPLPGNGESLALEWVTIDELEGLTDRPSVLVVRRAMRG